MEGVSLFLSGGQVFYNRLSPCRRISFRVVPFICGPCQKESALSAKSLHRLFIQWERK